MFKKTRKVSDADITLLSDGDAYAGGLTLRDTITIEKAMEATEQDLGITDDEWDRVVKSLENYRLRMRVPRRTPR